MRRTSLPPELESGLVLFYPEYPNSGTSVFDVSGTGNAGTLVNTPTKVRRYGYEGFQFNGSNQSITYPNINGVVGFSASIYPTANNDNIILFSTGVSVDINGSNVLTATGLTGATTYVNGVAGSALTQNKWNHVLVTFTSLNTSSGSIANSQFTGFIVNPKLYGTAPGARLIELDAKAFFIP